jgi:hypothetical protein
MARPPLPPGEGISGGTITFRLTPKQRDEINAILATDPNMTQTAVVRTAIEEFVARHYNDVSGAA